MVTCCDYIYFLCGDTYIMNVTERHFFGEARAPQGQGLSVLSIFFFCVCFLFFFTVVCEQGLKRYTPQATLLTTSSLLRHEENLVP